MSYSIDEGIDDAEKWLQALKDVRAVYPNARKDGQRWVSEDVSLEKCDGFELYVDESSTFNAGRICARFYQTVGTGRVYRGWGNIVMLSLFFNQLQNENPKLHAKIMEAMKKSCS